MEECDVASKVSLLHFKSRCGLVYISTYGQCICLNWGLLLARTVFQFWPNSSTGPAAKSDSLKCDCVKLERGDNMTFGLLLQMSQFGSIELLGRTVTVLWLLSP